MNADRTHNEIIIVRRQSDDEGDHHSSAWKIAFADFMTAMMALFLVMWLTNATDDSVKKQIAQYFNPIKLNAAAPSTRGLDQGHEGVLDDVSQRGTAPVERDGLTGGRVVAGEEGGGEEQAIFRDPYAVLAEIAAESGGSGADETNGPPDGSGRAGLNGGEAYRDPFDPTSWQLQPNALASGGAIANAPPPEFETTVVENAVPGKAGPGGTQAQQNETAAADRPTEPAGEPAGGATGEAKTPEKSTGAAGAETEAPEEGGIAAQLARELEPGERAGEVEVSQGEEGVMIALSDSLDSGMFEVGSVKPTPEAVRMMEKIAAVLAERPGRIVIRGHTDARPYRGEGYDNWRLSTARAHMAYYMLVRGGLDEERVLSIEGFADRRLKNPEKPEAAENRRIEILLLEPDA